MRPDRLVSVHVGKENQGIVFRTRPLRSAVSRVEDDVHSRWHLFVVPENVGQWQMFATFERKLTKDDVSPQAFSQRSLVLEQYEFLVWALIPLNADDSDHLQIPPTR